MLQYSTGARTALLDTGSFKAVFNNHVIKIFGGTKPVDADAAIGAATLLCTVSLNSTGAALDWAAAAAAGAITKNLSSVWSGLNVADGNAVFFRLETAADTNALSTTAVRIQGDCGIAGSDLNLSSLVFVNGAPTLLDFGNVAFPVS